MKNTYPKDEYGFYRLPESEFWKLLSQMAKYDHHKPENLNEDERWTFLKRGFQANGKFYKPDFEPSQDKNPLNKK